MKNAALRGKPYAVNPLSKKSIVLMTWLLAGVAGAANTWWVDDDAASGGTGSESAPYQTIQAAIDAAAAGDTIKVEPGTYATGATRDAVSDGKNLTRVLITKKLRIESTDGAAATHIVGSDDDTASETADVARQNGLGANAVRCVMAMSDAEGSILKGFTIRDGRSRYDGNANNIATHAGGVAAEKEGVICVVDCVISNNVATRGGACRNVSLIRSLLVHNRATNNGGAATRVCNQYACVFAHNGNSTASLPLSAIADPRSVIHCSIFGNGNGGVHMEAAYGAPVYNTVSILEGNNNGSPGSFNIGSSTTKAPTLSHCVYTLISNSATRCTVDLTKNLTNASVTPWQTMVSPYSGDYRAVKGGLCDGTGDATLSAPDWVPDEFRGFDFYGKPFVRDGQVNIGAVAASAAAAGGVHFLSGSTTWRVDGYEKSESYGEKMYMRGLPTEHLTVLENAENKIFNWEQHWTGDKTWYRFFDNGGKLVLTMPPAGSVVTNWSNGAKGVVYVNPNSGNDTDNDGSAAIADGNGKGPVKTLKKAVELASANYVIHCAEGTYESETTTAASLPTRLVLNKQVVVRGAGAGRSIIKGNYDAALPADHGCGDAGIRCVYANNDSYTTAVIGFTLKDGCTKGGSAANSEPYKGGGFYAPSCNCRAQLIDCVVTNCAGSRGGVMFGGWAQRTVFVGNNLCNVGSESYRRLIMSACVVKDGNPAKGGYHTVANDDFLVFNTTFVGNGNPADSATTIYAQIEKSAKIVLNCVVDGDHQGLVNNIAAGNYQNYKSGQTGWTYQSDLKLADRANRDLRPRADSPLVGGGSLGGSDVYSMATSAEWLSMVTSTDVDGNPYLYVDGKPTAGAYQRPVAVVTVEVAAAGEVEPTGTWIKQEGDVVTLTAKGASNRKFLGFWVNGELVPQSEKTYTFAVPGGIYSQPFVLKAAYNTDWYVNADQAVGNDANDGWTPETAKRTLVEAMKGPVSGDTVHAAAGVYGDGDGTVADGPGSTTKCRVNVPAGVTLRGDDRDGTIIEGKAPSLPDKYGLGEDGVRGVYLSANAKLCNLTVRKGYTKNGASAAESFGGGVLGADRTTCFVEDCTIRDCRGSRSGGGHYVTFNRCRLLDNYGASTGAAGRGCSYYNTYISGCKGNYRPMQDSTAFINCTYANDATESATVDPFVGVNVTVANSVFLCDKVQLKNNVVSLKNVVFLEGGGVAMNVQTVANVTTNTAAEIALDDSGCPMPGSVLIDAGDDSQVGIIGDLDYDGGQRVYNGTIDIGCCEHDWRGRYGTDVGATVTAATPEVVERTVGGTNRVFLPSGEMGVAWGLGVGVNGRITAQVTGNGVLEMYVGDDEEPTHWWTAGSPELFKWRSTVADANLRFRYLPGEGDAGGAYVKSFETRGMTLIVR